jgi:KDO2-lipid IV(A) lauroyltransferase
MPSRINANILFAWVGIGSLWLSIKILPWAFQQKIGKWIGRALLVAASKRKQIAAANLKLAFPNLTENEHKKLLRLHFESFGVGIFEVGQGWWGSENFLSTQCSIDGLEHFDRAIAKGRGVILLSAHFTTLEITGHMLGIRRPVNVLYRRNQNPVIERFLKKGRERHAVGTVHKDDIRGMIRLLKRGGAVWFAFDQHYNGKDHVFATFFGIPTATNTATSRMAKITKCSIVPFFGHRKENGSYNLTLLPELDGFPSEDVTSDTNRLNSLIEDAIKIYPEQYLWVHRRYRDALNYSDPYNHK